MMMISIIITITSIIIMLMNTDRVGGRWQILIEPSSIFFELMYFSVFGFSNIC